MFWVSLSTSSTLQRKQYYQGCLPNNFSWISKRNLNLICLQTILFLTPKNNLVVRQPSHLTQSHLIQLVQALIHLFFSHPMCNSRVQKCFVGCSSRIYPESIHFSPFPITPINHHHFSFGLTQQPPDSLPSPLLPHNDHFLHSNMCVL